jgi:hypothetical protein
MTLRAAEFIGFALFFGACTSAPSEPTPVRWAGIYVAPDSLESLAAEVRSTGGIVVVGSADGASVSRSPSVGPAPNLPAGVFMSLPLEGAGVTVSDGLGDTTAANVVVIASGGPMILVDELGAPSADYVLVLEDEELFSLTEMPAEGEWVFFLSEREGELWLRWRARVMPDGSVDGSRTRFGESASLSSLRTGA